MFFQDVISTPPSILSTLEVSNPNIYQNGWACLAAESNRKRGTFLWPH